MPDMTVKRKVKEKFDLAADVKEAQIKTTIYRVEKVDGKIKADFEINNLPGNKSKTEISYEDRNRTIPKIFDNMEGFVQYATDFFNKSDEEIIELCKNT